MILYKIKFNDIPILYIYICAKIITYVKEKHL